MELRDKNEALIQSKLGRRAGSGLTLLNNLFRNPIISVKDVEEICSLSPKAANGLVDIFVKLNVLVEMTGQKRYRIFLYEKYLDLFD